MKIEEIERTLKEIREREDYLVKLISDKDIDVCYYSGGGMYGGGRSTLFTLNKEEKEYLKTSCIARIKELKKSIECLTD